MNQSTPRGHQIEIANTSGKPIVSHQHRIQDKFIVTRDGDTRPNEYILVEFVKERLQCALRIDL